MWMQKEEKFLYFFFTPSMCINNNRIQKVFSGPFSVDLLEKKRWESNGNSQILAPETLTYWSKDDEM